MNNYRIIFYNKDLKIKKEVNSEVQSFQEASRDANVTRCKLGLDWEILSIEMEESQCQD